MIDRKIEGYSDTIGSIITGRCCLVFNDALASGINEYISMTYLLVEDNDGKVHTVKPRNVYKFLENVDIK